VDIYGMSRARGDEMAERRDALTELVRQHVGAGRQWSTRRFAETAVDPDTGWSPSKSLVAKIVAGDGYDVTPQLVGALAVGLGLERGVVAAAAHFQVIGYEMDELVGGAPALLVRRLDEESGAVERSIAARWVAETEHQEDSGQTPN
jgi:hypothetical protein